MYDFANSGYTTVVLTAIYSAYFVGVVARANGADSGTATLLWTLAMGVTNLLVLASAPVVGAIADHRAWKNAFCWSRPSAASASPWRSVLPAQAISARPWCSSFSRA